MTTEYAGAMELDPPLDPEEASWIRDGVGPGHGGWIPVLDGSALRPRPEADPAELVAWLRDLVAAGHWHVSGAVAAYDTDTRELVLISARNGRVTRRAVRSGSRKASRSNVIDLATHRRTISRQIS
jgi:hypothetical protein